MFFAGFMVYFNPEQSAEGFVTARAEWSEVEGIQVKWSGARAVTKCEALCKGFKYTIKS